MVYTVTSAIHVSSVVLKTKTVLVKMTMQDQMQKGTRKSGFTVCKPAFSSAFFHEFRHVGDIAKITGCEYLKSRAILLCYLVQQAKMLKLRQTK